MEIKTCPKCQANVSEDAHFCAFCGADITVDVPDEQEERICRSCGTVLGATQKFCHACGTEYRSPLTVCAECGAKLIPGAPFCGECGTRVPSFGSDIKIVASSDGAASGEPPRVFPDAIPAGMDLSQNSVQEAESTTRVKKKCKIDVIELVKRSCVLMLAVIVTVLAFLPIVEMNLEINDEDYEIEISAIDNIVFFFDSAKALDEEAIMDTDIYDKCESLSEKFAGALTGDKDFERADELFHLYIRLMLISDEIDTTPSLILSAVISFLYILSAVVLLVFASLYFAAFFIKKLPSFTKTAVRMIAAVLSITLLSFISSAILMDLGSDIELSEISIEISSTAAPVLITVFSAAILAFIAVIRFFVTEKPAVKVGSIIKRSVAIVFSLTLMLLSLSPVIKTTAKTIFDGKTKDTAASTKFNSSFYTALELSEKEIESMSARNESEVDYSVTSYFGNFSNYSKTAYENGRVFENSLLVKELLLGYGGYDYADTFALGSVVAMLLAISAAALLWFNIVSVVDGYDPKCYYTIPLKAMSVIFAILVLVLAIVLKTVVNTNAEEFSEMNYRISVTAGPIFMIIFAALTSGIPMGKKKDKKEKTEESLPVDVE